MPSLTITKQHDSILITGDNLDGVFQALRGTYDTLKLAGEVDNLKRTLTAAIDQINRDREILEQRLMSMSENIYRAGNPQ